MSDKFLYKGKYDLRLCLVIILLIAAVVVWLTTCASGDSKYQSDVNGKQLDGLFGTWVKSDSDAYYFDGLGRGTLTTGEKTYAFDYELSDGEISINYSGGSMKKESFEYELNDELLTFKTDESSCELAKKD